MTALGLRAGATVIAPTPDRFLLTDQKVETGVTAGT